MLICLTRFRYPSQNKVTTLSILFLIVLCCVFMVKFHVCEDNLSVSTNRLWFLILFLHCCSAVYLCLYPFSCHFRCYTAICFIFRKHYYCGKYNPSASPTYALLIHTTQPSTPPIRIQRTLMFWITSLCSMASALFSNVHKSTKELPCC